uniref:Uncharacterized protein n=1 Tax=Ralstonia solanacearum TaxID=305 RepID=A0A0S4V995_RALSL|nr:protein of unknown function [Ralstonia solanacearum]
MLYRRSDSCSASSCAKRMKSPMVRMGCWVGSALMLAVRPYCGGALAVRRGAAVAAGRLRAGAAPLRGLKSSKR